MLCGAGLSTVQLAADAALVGVALELTTVSVVGVMPVIAVDEVSVCVIWIVVGLVLDPATSTGANRSLVAVAPDPPGTHTSEPPVLMLLTALANVVHVFDVVLYE